MDLYSKRKRIWGGAAHLELVLQQVLLVGQLAVEAEELQLLLIQFLDGHVRTHTAGSFMAGFCKSHISYCRDAAQGGSPVTYARVHLVLLVRVHGCECGSGLSEECR
jgi:hypothetical protein